LKTGNEIIETGNGIISPTSRPLIKKLNEQKFFDFLIVGEIIPFPVSIIPFPVYKIIFKIL
jgi:hypothetical protein